jgi:hypothetical protein
MVQPTKRTRRYSSPLVSSQPCFGSLLPLRHLPWRRRRCHTSNNPLRSRTLLCRQGNTTPWAATRWNFKLLVRGPWPPTDCLRLRVVSREKASSDIHAALKSISERMVALNYGQHLRAAKEGRALAPDLNQCNSNPFDGCCYAFSSAFSAWCSGCFALDLWLW